ncbi:PLP-dependent aminotransferase family protein [Gammaproteobacteria bacterium]|nr:PLP-dependent aminotransferase family protein [Gammaproteobacteria bacterium]
MTVQTDDDDCTGKKTSTLTEQLVRSLGESIASGKLPAGSRLPSIRAAAPLHSVSRFTVVQAYDRLVATGLIEARRGAGFFVLSPPTFELDADRDHAFKEDYLATGVGKPLSPSIGWLPAHWLDREGFSQSMRRIARSTDSSLLEGYGDERGYGPLREAIRQRLAQQGMQVHADQVLTTAGAAAALVASLRTVINYGDAVLTDSPGYAGLYGRIRAIGRQVVGVPWDSGGPIISELERLIETHRPKAMVSTAICQNPTGITLSTQRVHQVLRLIERHDLWLIEDNVFGVFHDASPVSYARLDGFERVIYVNSYSKTVTPKARVGYLVAPSALADRIARSRLRVDLRAGEINERIVHQLIVSGRYRKHVAHLIERLQLSRQKAVSTYSRLGFTFQVLPDFGLFLWAKHEQWPDSRQLAELAAKEGIFVNAGAAYLAEEATTPWMRLSVAWCNDPRIVSFFERQLKPR